MPKLLASQVQITFYGLFSQPMFSVWGQGEKILGGLFNAFKDYNVTAGDMRYETTSPNVTDSVISVSLFNSSANYKYKVDRVEAVFNDFTEEQSQRIPEVLQHGDSWLRSLGLDFSFKSQLLLHTSHNQLSEGTSEEFLKALSSPDVPDIGNSKGNGITFHWDIPERDWDLSMAVDHSAYVTNGLFVQFLLKTTHDKLDYVDTFQAAISLGRTALAKLGLSVQL